ncbi:MAG: polyphosphate polymerase domain-containing protein [Ruminococcaceae bacterium]|nr:polyphosphate polymerase domain-containing protein [Oscillospiraceae bacterium]
MAIEVFRRSEKKYVIDNEAYLKMRNFLKTYMISDKYNKDDNTYHISNIYYDTHDDYLVRNSIEKPIYKEKIRLRTYGTPDLNSFSYIELKKKYNGITYKRRTKIKLYEAYDFLNNKIFPENNGYINKQVLNEISYFISVYNPVPKIKISYDRYAFFSLDTKDLRVSFDRNIFFNTENLQLESSEKGNRLLKEDYWILEIKAEKGIPIWLTNYLSENKIYSTGFSKYGSIHKRLISLTKEDDKCFMQQQLPLLAKSLL